MGMTYQIIAKSDSVSQNVCDYIQGISELHHITIDISQSGVRLNLTDDMLFDRECLGTWMGVKDEDFISYECKFRITKGHLDRAILTLQTLVDKISTMPFVEGENSETYCQYNVNGEPGTEAEYEYYGPPENIAIMKEVMKVFNRETHYTYPWEDTTYGTRQGRMIQALTMIRDFMEKFPEWEIIGLYY